MVVNVVVCEPVDAGILFPRDHGLTLIEVSDWRHGLLHPLKGNN